MSGEIKGGDKVRVGKGRTVWTVQQLWTGAGGAQLATLHKGWSSTTVDASRLNLVEEP
jgi:hypothetical protein